jgi:hypothetical protein
MGDKSIKNDKIKKKKKSTTTATMPSLIRPMESHSQPELIRKKKKDKDK